MKWEYSIYGICGTEAVHAYSGYEELLQHDDKALTTIKHLNNFGADGWEVIDVDFGESYTNYHMKRPVS